MFHRDYLLWIPACLLLVSLPLVLKSSSTDNRADTDSAATTSPNRYVGSHACAECHSEIYESWQHSSHSKSTLTAEQARAAGYPLPERDTSVGDGALSLAWEQVSFLVGDRERLAYVDDAGNVLAESYHHRVGQWDPFPEKTFADCGPCHTTGFKQVDDADRFGKWAELNIGCESCHGPGQRHMDSYEAKDVLVDDSSRTCGGCHTSVGRVLPPDEWHRTHDQVQEWHSDQHVTGLRFHSHSAFCARCHAPRAGHFVEASLGAKKRVFSEAKQTITCISCHDPHGSNHAEVALHNVSLVPPEPPEVYIHRGNDADFTTADHQLLDGPNASCLVCHRGADRIDLDHAHATCVDCHNTFYHNRAAESRLSHDANHTHLSCRPCHEDADHLLTLLFDDRDFLAPRHIHNLRTLPGKVLAKYRFRYPDLAPSTRAETLSSEKTEEQANEPIQEVDHVAVEQNEYADRLQKQIADLFLKISPSGSSHETEVSRLQDEIQASPHEIKHYLRLALALAAEEEGGLARRVLEFASRAQLPRLLVDLGFDPHQSNEAVNRSCEQLHTLLTHLAEPIETTAGEDHAWFEGLILLAAQRYEDASASVARYLQEHADTEHLGLLLALAEFGQNRTTQTFEMLTDGREALPSDVSSQVMLGIVHLRQHQFAKTRTALKAAADRGEPTAHYFLAWGYLEQQNPRQAIEHYRAAVALDPGFLEARMGLARAYRLVGAWELAIGVYREIIRHNVENVQPHLHLAQLYKSYSDRLTFQSYDSRESRPPRDATTRQWQQHLLQSQSRSAEYRQLARDEYIAVLRLHPLHEESTRQIAEIARRDGQFQEALYLFGLLERQEPEEWIYPYRQGDILIRLSRQSEAIGALKRALKLAPAQGDIYCALGVALLQQGEADKAVEVLRTGIVYEPFSPTMFTNLGVAYGLMKDFEKARSALERSLELATFPLPRVHLTYTNQALIHAKCGEFGRARQALESALHVYPDYAYAVELHDKLSESDEDYKTWEDSSLVINDLTEIFGEVTTVVFEHD